MNRNNDLSTCINQAMTFFRHLDERNYDGLTALLTENATWHRQGKTLQGRQQVHEALIKRSPTLRIHHLMINTMADHLDQAICLMRGYMLVVRYEPDGALEGPAPLSGIESIRTTHIEFRRVGPHWLIHAMRNDEPTFAAAA